MKSYLSLSWKELLTQRVTSVLILIAVILSTMATTAMGRSIGILQVIRMQQAASLNGDRYATFHQLTEAQKDALHADPRLTDVGSLINLGSVELGNSSLSLFLREFQGDALKAYPSIGTIQEGRLPTGKNEIAIPEDALQYLDFHGQVGDKITLPVQLSLMQDDRPPYTYTAEFTLTGILKSSFVGYATGTVDAVVGEGTAQDLLPQRYFLYSTDFKTAKSVPFHETIQKLAETLQVAEPYIQYNWVLLNALGIAYNEKADSSQGFPFMMVACVLVGALVLLAAGLVIYNILKVAVSKRIREYGTLRALGSTQKQLYTLVTVQLLLLCGLGIPVGLVLGICSAKGILTAAMGMLNPELFLAESSEALADMVSGSGTGSIFPLLCSIVITLIFALLAAVPSARYAARVSPTVAMHGQATAVKRRSRKKARIRNFEAYYARLNLKRNRSRTAITIVSIVMSITVFVALQSFSGLLDTSRDVKELHAGDYSVTNETTGISADAIAQLAAQDGVEKLSTTKLTIYNQDEQGNLPINLDIPLQSWEAFQIAAVDRERLSDLAVGLSSSDISDLNSGTACLAVNPIPFSYEGQEVSRTQLQAGDSITVNGVQLRVAGIVEHAICINNEGYLNGVQLIVTDDLYDRLTGNSRYAEVYPTLKKDADEAAFEAFLNAWCQENPGSHVLSYRQSDAQLAESYEQIRLLCWGLILFIGLIGVLNIINTVYTNIHTRTGEIGMQRAMGMSVGSLYKTFLWEGAYYGLIASGLGAVGGYICTVFVEAATSDSLQLAAVPVVPILAAAVISVAACLAATAIPLRAIGSKSIVDAIETAE